MFPLRSSLTWIYLQTFRLGLIDSVYALTMQRYRIRRRISQIQFPSSALLHPVFEVGRRRIVALRDELLGEPVGEQRLDFRTVLVQLSFAGACNATVLMNMRDIEAPKEDDGFEVAFLNP